MTKTERYPYYVRLKSRHFAVRIPWSTWFGYGITPEWDTPDFLKGSTIRVWEAKRERITEARLGSLVRVDAKLGLLYELVLRCPQCGVDHTDAPTADVDRRLCHKCGHAVVTERLARSLEEDYRDLMRMG